MENLLTKLHLKVSDFSQMPPGGVRGTFQQCHEPALWCMHAVYRPRGAHRCMKLLRSNLYQVNDGILPTAVENTILHHLFEL